MRKLFQNHKQKITFETFLSGMPSRDYIFQNAPFAEQIEQAARMIREADYILLGAGAGMSAAAGAQYGGKFFQEHFGEFQKLYGNGPYMRDMYLAGFYPFPDEAAFWGFWSKLALTAGADLDVTPLHRTLLNAFEDKKLFLLTTNADHQFEKAGLPAEQVFATQGSYNLIQCKQGCHQKTYHAVSLFRRMNAARRDGKIPAQMVPQCPVCGGPMAMNLRTDSHFVQDKTWYAAEKRFGDFLNECMDQKTVLVELGVGFNTPTIIRFPFEHLAQEHENISLVRLNIREGAVVPQSFGDRVVGIDADMAKSIAGIAGLIRETGKNHR